MAYVLYRAIRRKEARLTDFWSDFAHGEEPIPQQLKKPMLWSGISTFDDFNIAKSKAIQWWQGRFLAELHIPDDADAIVFQSGRNGHHSVMATPATLVSLVQQVLPIIDESTP